ncbi:MAG: hypothetical protein QF858_03750 [Candidatus Pacebacteria bacterium]|jgi:hypothetical protein|nr:hypothetical protein [bacterium]MDP6527958.1 hypothetical protein [Candidatus Paceibacterota bacterium]|tara:strand:- start:16818 stop:17054 length:237 start_codon:yes stop_codon:yes gene_type:complete
MSKDNYEVAGGNTLRLIGATALLGFVLFVAAIPIFFPVSGYSRPLAAGSVAVFVLAGLIFLPPIYRIARNAIRKKPPK